ncbi:hypothetical protein Vadar_015583 [Vaccinium darrowii]|uniref:Uncharacterized protein n=1 Tax=Vaccinium darrowii TaxID=229202 RepID=A0ACB7XHN7_9ERIC|nr:hypothetical protein Vadar_015583 [Vaccinium darrowii]
MEDEADDREQAAHDGGHQREKKSSFVIQIPSYKEVTDTSQSSQPPPPSSLFTPSPSFSQAFNFIKNSEFYSPPPPPSTAAASTSRPFGNQPEAPSLSSSAVPSSSTTSQIANNRNAILVSHRQVSQWMSDKRSLQLSLNDIAVRLDLISKVHGTKLAENYFHDIPEKFNVVEAYGVLLNIYALEKSVKRAEAIMEKLRELGQTTFTFNVMLNLYRQTEKRDKIDLLVQEMEEKRTKYDKFTFSILLNVYATSLTQ